MKMLEETRYQNGVLTRCSVNGTCPLEAACIFWSREDRRCMWPETSRKSAGKEPELVR